MRGLGGSFARNWLDRVRDAIVAGGEREEREREDQAWEMRG